MSRVNIEELCLISKDSIGEITVETRNTDSLLIGMLIRTVMDQQDRLKELEGEYGEG